MTILSKIILALSLVASVVAQERNPKFSDYRAGVVRITKPAKVKIHSTPYTACFRTMLRDTALKGERFAGHYAWSYWGCGTECARIGIVDLITGRSYVSPFFMTGVGIKTQPDSRLMLINDPQVVGKHYGDPVPPSYQPAYFLWNGHQLLEVLGNGRLGPEWHFEFGPCRG